MVTVNSKSKLLLIKYLLITGAVAAIGIILLIVIVLTILGESGSGFALGLAIDPVGKSMIGLQILSSIAIAYFIGPMAVNAISQGQSGPYVGIKSLLICWTAPWILLTLIAAIQDLSWNFMLINGIVAFIPAVIIGPLVGRAMRKKIMK
ncbi:hypothetical protein SYJ56_21555 [Algoriphagus sp. D3-2-R+10]|uniref:hypothetical protein n=1 Tax=Algoriphagus aurantiacus TaxID=3103948 RepID=UPI002B3E9647|nr:hypothetical protein [Algoriphagus sp. D3-2-R+10]MEB2777915.1 hypothetical protein [Algoriphagus sp. D3-2-R+10]